MIASDFQDCADALCAWLDRQLAAGDLAQVIPPHDPLRMWWTPAGDDLCLQSLLEVLVGAGDLLTLLALVQCARTRGGAEPLPPELEGWLAEQLIAHSRRARTPAAEPAFDAFLSYCHRDRARLEPLFALLRGEGLRLFLDAEQIGPGDHIVARLHAGIAQAPRAILFVTENYLTSTWAQRELAALLRHSRNAAMRLLPVLLDRVALPASIADLCTVDLRAWNATNDSSQARDRLQPLIENCRRRN